MFNNVILPPIEVEKLIKDLYEDESKMDASEIVKEVINKSIDTNNDDEDKYGVDPDPTMLKNVAVKPGFFIPLASKLKGFKNP